MAALALVLAVFAAVCVGVPNPAAATFPGANGRILMEVRDGTERDEDCLTPSCVERRLASVDPRSGRLLAFDPCRNPVECYDLHPAFSPDGRRIAFTSSRYSTPPSPGQYTTRDRNFLAVTGLRGNRVRLLAEPAFHPAWSPNGRWIAFVRQGDIHMASPDGGEVRLVMRGSASELDWSARGGIAFTRYRGSRSDIFTVRPDGTRVRRLTTGGESSDPSWSPDGRTLAYTREVRSAARGFRLDVVVQSENGSTVRVVRGGAFPAWSPDGRHIAFVRRTDLWLVRLRDGTERRLHRVQTDGIEDGIASLAWRPIVRSRERSGVRSGSDAPRARRMRVDLQAKGCVYICGSVGTRGVGPIAGWI